MMVVLNIALAFVAAILFLGMITDEKNATNLTIAFVAFLLFIVAVNTIM